MNVNNSLIVGAAKVDITPDPQEKQFLLNGYSDRKKLPATGVLDRVHARAIVGSDREGKLFGLVSADLCWVSNDLHDEVSKRLQPHGFDEHNLMLAATHTHSSFGGYDRTFIIKRLFGKFDKEILEHAASLIAQAVVEAKDAMRPARLEIAVEQIANMNRSRLDPAFVFGADETESAVRPDPERYPVDERLTVVRIVEADSKPIGAVVHFAAHPTILSPKNMKVSADFPGVLCSRMEEALGSEAVALYLNGTLGDTAPVPDWESDVETEITDMKDYGNELADAAIGILEFAKPLPIERIAYNTTPVRIPRVIVRQFRRLKLPSFLSKLVYSKKHIPFQAMRIGDLVLLAIPGELTTEVGRELEKLCPEDTRCLVVAPANSYVGYLVTPQQYEDGGYASDTCFFGPNTLDFVKASAQEALSGVR